MMEKRNVVEEKRTPDHEFTRPDEHWDKKAADMFQTLPPVQVIGEHEETKDNARTK